MSRQTVTHKKRGHSFNFLKSAGESRAGRLPDVSFPGSELAGYRHGVHAPAAMTGKKSDFPRRRRSASADAALEAELERIGQMTIEERIKAALSLRDRFTWLPATAKTK